MSSLLLHNNSFYSYTKDYFENSVIILWYNKQFSQSQFPPGQTISNACTLICLLVAQRISRTRLLIEKVDKSPQLIAIIAEAIIEGNTTHACIVRKGLVSDPYLNTEEALKLGGRSLNLLREWKFKIFHEKIQSGLYEHINNFLHEWYLAPKSMNLFMLLITCGRTVLFIFQEKTYMVTFFDSHSHSTNANPNRGLVIAQTGMDKLEDLCNWYTKDILKIHYNRGAKPYELAFLYPCNSLHYGGNSLCKCGNYLRK